MERDFATSQGRPRCLSQPVSEPLAIGIGRPLFEGVEDQMKFRLESSRAFENGSVVLDYAAG